MSMTVIPNVLDEVTARCMGEFDAQIAAETDPEAQAVMRAARPRIEALVRRRNAEELGKAALAMAHGGEVQ